MKCNHCREEMIEHNVCTLGYGQRRDEYECPNNCEYLEYLDKFKNHLAERTKRFILSLDPAQAEDYKEHLVNNFSVVQILNILKKVQ